MPIKSSLKDYLAVAKASVRHDVGKPIKAAAQSISRKRKAPIAGQDSDSLTQNDPPTTVVAPVVPSQPKSVAKILTDYHAARRQSPRLKRYAKPTAASKAQARRSVPVPKPSPVVAAAPRRSASQSSGRATKKPRASVVEPVSLQTTEPVTTNSVPPKTLHRTRSNASAAKLNRSKPVVPSGTLPTPPTDSPSKSEAQSKQVIADFLRDLCPSTETAAELTQDHASAIIPSPFLPGPLKLDATNEPPSDSTIRAASRDRPSETPAPQQEESKTGCANSPPTVCRLAPSGTDVASLAARQKETEAIREARLNHRYGIADPLDGTTTETIPLHLNRPASSKSSPLSATFHTASPAALPGYRRFDHLKSTPSSKAAAVQLPLPMHLQRLDLIFQAVEHTIMFLRGQNQTCVFHRIKKPVENMCHRTFDTMHLGQIKTLYPDAYRFEAVRYMHNGERVASVEINVQQAPVTSTSGDGTGTDGASGGDAHLANTVFAVSSLEARRLHFKNQLLAHVFEHHNRFLGRIKVDPVVSIDALSQWHCDFDLENDVPHVAVAALPRLELHTVSQNRVKDLLSRLKTRSTLTKSEPGLPSPVATPQPLPSCTSTISSPVADSSAPPAAKPAKLSLIERIRQKERERKEKAMKGLVTTPAQAAHDAMVSRLPVMADTLSFLFYANHKNVLRFKDMAAKLADSYKMPLSESEAMEHIRMMAKLVPQWCKVVSIGSETMLKLDRTVSLRQVKDILSANSAK
ncbi:hypothetical protein H4R34_001374 [Dimargaris verticillata]|uniref:CDT1 Geminin-binding domain-containing protein n=1 Tax=Dimargaris verticillata TaxID=2761393 RepID=A0A9W8BA20_9FUNG|nr:hypothetical protein H4R34_001374 [Dimargaris verticillata]